MWTAQRLADGDDSPPQDHVVLIRGATWADYQRQLELRRDRNRPRLSYLEGTLEIMSPSFMHERIKSLIGCLIEVWCLEKGVPFSKMGSWTLERKDVERGIEPDECYILSAPGMAERPDLVIEVVWKSAGIDKLEIYRKLGVREVWIHKDGRLTIHALDGESYQPVTSSRLLPGIDVAHMLTFLDRGWTSDAVQAYRAALRGEG